MGRVTSRRRDTREREEGKKREYMIDAHFWANLLPQWGLMPTQT